MDCEEPYLSTSHKKIPQIGADIAEKGHLWMETN
jgi:hypothetical protein